MIIKIYPPQAIQEMGRRSNQEDFIFPALGNATPADSLFVVCDGMGGHEHGEVASETFATALARFFEARVSPDVVLTDATIASAIDSAYSQLDAVDDGSYKKMGTTLTMLYLHRGGVTAAHIGDSRIYHIRPGVGPLYVSRDHSLVFDLYQSGEISYDEMKTSPQKNLITRTVQPGEENRESPDIIHITDVKAGDYFYLCSDGMLEHMEDDELVQLLSAGDSDEKKRQRLIDATTGCHDNHSAYLIRVEEVVHEDDDKLLGANEEPTARCNALNIKPKMAHHGNRESAVGLGAPVSAVERAMPAPPVKRGGSRLWLWLLLLAALLLGAIYYGIKGKDDGNTAALPDTVKVVKPIKPIKPIEHVSSTPSDDEADSPGGPNSQEPDKHQ